MSATLKILITSQKGGVGKSTVSANLAAYFAHTAGKSTALVDLDHQATAGKWVRSAAPIGAVVEARRRAPRCRAS